MTHDLDLSRLHLTGEQSSVEPAGVPPVISLDSFAGPVRVEWDAGAALTPLGQLPFFVDFLKTSGLFEAFIADCPLHYIRFCSCKYLSPNAPKKRDVMGTAMPSHIVRAQALRPYCGAARRWRPA